MTRKINNSYELGQSNAPTDGGDMLKTRGDGTLVWEGVADTTYVPVSWYGGRGVFGGGRVSSATNVIDYITISTTGNAIDFGDMSVARYSHSGCSDGSRGVFAGGDSYNTIDYITISTLGNATDFGDLTTTRKCDAQVSNDINNRAVFAGDRSTANMEYVNIASTGNASSFGNLIVAFDGGGSVSNGTNDRGVFSAGEDIPGYTNEIEYITISTTGNSTDFGDMTSSYQGWSSCSGAA